MMNRELLAAQYRQILERCAVMQSAPVWDDLPDAEKRAFVERMTDLPVSWAEVSEADKELIRAGEGQVSVGQGRLQSVVELGDWGAIDAAIDSEDVDEMDAALFTVGHAFPREPWLGRPGASLADLEQLVEDPNVTDDPGDLIDPDDLPDDDSEWVGV